DVAARRRVAHVAVVLHTDEVEVEVRAARPAIARHRDGRTMGAREVDGWVDAAVATTAEDGERTAEQKPIPELISHVMPRFSSLRRPIAAHVPACAARDRRGTGPHGAMTAGLDTPDSRSNARRPRGLAFLRTRWRLRRRDEDTSKLPDRGPSDPARGAV